MAVTPRMVIATLDTLHDELRAWSVTASDTIHAAESEQRKVAESSARAVRESHIAHDQAMRDLGETQRVCDEMAALVSGCADILINANDNQASAQQTINTANFTLNFWQNELVAAQRWLQRAEARLAKAEHELEEARRYEQQCRNHLHSAESDLSSCRNNKERRNCWSEQAQVAAAQSALITAIDIRRICEAEVMAAREEVALAKARVICCTRSVAFAEQGLQMAKDAFADAEQACSDAGHAKDYAAAADQAAHTSALRAESQLISANESLTFAINGEKLTEEAQGNLRRATEMEENAQRYSMEARLELNEKTQDLMVYDRPTLRL